MKIEQKVREAVELKANQLLDFLKVKISLKKSQSNYI